jgi:putative spermidine/putrescine transport system permease protein
MSTAAVTASRRRSSPQRLAVVLGTPAIIFLVALFAFPMLRLLALSVEDGSLQYYEQALTDGLYLEVMWRTFKLAGIVTVLALVLGYPIAHFLTVASKFWALVGMTCVVLPFWTSLLVRTYAWMILLGNNGLINRVLQGLNITEDPVPLMNNELGVTIGMIHVLLPYFIFPVYSAMLRVDRSLLTAARGLGASRWNTLRLIYFPLTLHGVIAGCSLVFILSLGFFITPAILGGGRVMTIALLIEQQVNQALNWHFAAALCAILLIATLAIYAVLQRWSRTEVRHA